MPTIQDVFANPKFDSLSPDAQAIAVGTVYPQFQSLSPEAQPIALKSLRDKYSRPGIQAPKVPGLNAPIKHDTFMTGKFGPPEGYTESGPPGGYPEPTSTAGKIAKGFVNFDPITLGVPAGGKLASLAKRATGLGVGLAGGYGAHEAARKLGAPEILADIVGTAAGVWLAGKISPEAATQVEDVFKTKGAGAVKILLKKWGFSQASEAEGGFKIKPGVLRTSKYGGPTEPEYGQGTLPKLSEAYQKRLKERSATPEAPAPPAPPPPGKGTATKYGGPAEPEYGTTAYPQPKKSLTQLAKKRESLVPKEEKAAPLPKPFKRNPAIARKIAGGGPAPTEYGTGKPPLVRRPAGPGSSIKDYKPGEKGAEESTGAAGPQATPAKGDAATYVHDPKVDIGKTSRQLNLGAVASAQADVKNKTMAARFLRKTRQEILAMDEAEYKTHLKIVNAERKAKGLSQFEAPRPGVNRRTFKELLSDIADDADELRGKTPAPKPEKAPEPPKKDFEF